MRGAAILLAAALTGSTPALPDIAPDSSALPVIGYAPDFVLRAQDGTQVTLAQFRGKAVALTFIFAGCSSTCPILTAKMATVQDRLGSDFGSSIVFLSITVDPEHDTPDVLRLYAEAFGANPAGWKFLTGSPDAIQAVEHRYGVFAAPAPSGGDVDHTNLISVIDPRGMVRVQYLGVRFDPEELRHDLLSLTGKS
jgi:protein SCO1/2